MASKRRNIYLYLALACFVAILAIFIVDGYMGVYDTIYVTEGEREQLIDPEYWQRTDRPWTVSASSGDKVRFRYEVDNRQFSKYSANLEMSVWRSQERLLDLPSQQLSVAAFDRGEVEWVVDTSELLPGNPVRGQAYEYSVIIGIGELERRIIISIFFPPQELEQPVIPKRLPEID